LPEKTQVLEKGMSLFKRSFFHLSKNLRSPFVRKKTLNLTTEFIKMWESCTQRVGKQIEIAEKTRQAWNLSLFDRVESVFN
jgi:hypothetical protein